MLSEYYMFSLKYPTTVIQLGDETPKVCLNMIVKNESRVIIRLLNSIVKLIDGYCICDTGSTDNTIELMTTFFLEHNIPGKIVEEPFRDFGYNRTFALKAAATIPNMDYLLLLDADMILTGSYLEPENIKAFKKSLTHDYYHICQGTATYYYKNVRLLKNYRDFSYWGVTHEYVNAPDGAQSSSFENSQLFINDIGDGGAKSDKFERDIRLLTKGLEEHPNNDRYTFYLANSLKDAGHYDRAIEMYYNRIKIGGWIEEVWYSYFNIGRCYVLLGQMEKAICVWLEGFDYYPKRLEAIYEVIKYYREKGKNKLAYLYYVAADTSNKKWGSSSEYLFLQKDIYDYKLDYEMTIVGYYAHEGSYNINNINMKVIADPQVDDDTIKNVINNYKFYSKKLVEKNQQLFKQNMDVLLNATKSLNITNSGEYVTSTPSITQRGNYLILNVRYVNYRIDEQGNYVNQEKISTKNAIAMIDVSKSIWKMVEEFELKYNESFDNQYMGLEDVRLMALGNTVYYNSNRGLSYGNMAIEHGIIDISKESTCNDQHLKKVNQNAIEKNWVLFPTKNGEMKIIYNWSPTLIIGDIHEDQFVETHQIPVPRFFKYLRGSTNGVIIQDEVWFICHAVSYEDRRYYYHIIVVLDRDTYQLKRYTPFFTFEGEKVEYTLGFQYLESSDTLLIGYSVYDRSTNYMNIPRNSIEMILYG